MSSRIRPHDSARGSEQTTTSRRRTRGSVACDLCRSRKTRCDSRRPSCGYCSMHAATCTYPDEPPSTQPVPVTNTDILTRVNEVVALLHDLKRGQNQLPSLPSLAQESSTIIPQHPGPAHSAFADDGFAQLDVSDVAAKESACETVLRWPIIKSLGIDVAASSLGLEAVVLAEGTQPLRPGGLPQEGIVPLCHKFLTLIHVKNPILDVAQFLQHARDAAEYGPGWDAGGCLVLLACAIASVSTPYNPFEPFEDLEASGVSHDNISTAEAYFGAAQRRMGILPPSLVAVQCQYLAGLYSKFAVRPFQAWSFHQAACTQLQALLHAKQLVSHHSIDGHQSTRARHLEQRLYWSCVKSECELRIDLQLPSTGPFKYPDLFPSLSFPSTSQLHPLSTSPASVPQEQGLSPWSPAAWHTSPRAANAVDSDTALQPEEERSWLHYLAEISLRNLMNRILRELYERQDALSPQALVSRQLALIEEMTQWHAALPRQLSFTDLIPIWSTTNHAHRPDNELAFFLQTRYTCAFEWIYRPSLHLVLHEDGDAVDPSHKTHAAKAVHAAAAVITLVSTHHRHGGIWGLLRRSFACALMIIAVAARWLSETSGSRGYSRVALQPPPDWTALVHLSISTIRRWENGVSDVRRMRDVLELLLKNVNMSFPG